MATPGDIKLEIAVNAGTPTSGPQDVAFGDILTLSIDDPAGVGTYLFEIVEYPEGFPLPAGWTENVSTGSYQSTVADPPTVTMPASATWGKWFFRLIVNNALRAGAAAPDLIDEQTAVQILSPIFSLFDIGAREQQQFNPTGLPKEGWDEWLKADLRIIEANLSGGGGGSQDLESVLTIGPATVSQDLVVSAGTSVVLGSVTTPSGFIIGPNNTQLFRGESSVPGVHFDLFRVTSGDAISFGDTGQEFFSLGTSFRPGGLSSSQTIEWSNTTTANVSVGIQDRASGASFNLSILGSGTTDAVEAAGDVILEAGNNPGAGANGQIHWFVGGARHGSLDANGTNPALRFDGDQGVFSDIIVEIHSTGNGHGLRLFAGDADGEGGLGGDIEYHGGIAGLVSEQPGEHDFFVDADNVFKIAKDTINRDTVWVSVFAEGLGVTVPGATRGLSESMVLENVTAATGGAQQQNSPATTWVGHAWDSNATISTEQKFSIQVEARPFDGDGTASSGLVRFSSSNGTVQTTLMQFLVTAPTPGSAADVGFVFWGDAIDVAATALEEFHFVWQSVTGAGDATEINFTGGDSVTGAGASVFHNAGDATSSTLGDGGIWSASSGSGGASGGNLTLTAQRANDVGGADGNLELDLRSNGADNGSIDFQGTGTTFLTFDPYTTRSMAFDGVRWWSRRDHWASQCSRSSVDVPGTGHRHFQSAQRERISRQRVYRRRGQWGADVPAWRCCGKRGLCSFEQHGCTWAGRNLRMHRYGSHTNANRFDSHNSAR